jgi:ATP-dependent DNA helicase RecQ
MARPSAAPADPLRDLIARQWGFRTLRPLQEQAMRAVLDGRDSLVVLPTGGGKSLCYQAPALLRGDTTVVVSPLIALMKDQVDSLLAGGVPAAFLNSALADDERSDVVRRLRNGEIKLLFVSPERLTMAGFQGLLRSVAVRTFAIDEAHCISHWGHDFRPEYRQLAQLRDLFPDASVHAYTATATGRVQRDIITQLGLREPEILVGNFDRPNLTYRVVPRHELLAQVTEVLNRHHDEAGIIYCLRRRDVDELTDSLRKKGRKPLAYHAGMLAEERRDVQEAFRSERCDLIVATVAFGMGIDRPNVRFVLHTGMPKSVEHYQQEAGRAGRDGLPAECVLLYSGGDFMTLRSIIEKSAEEAGAGGEFVAESLRHLERMNAYCRGAACRHRTLVGHFGQTFEPANCGACDFCLGDVKVDPAGQVNAQKILSCVARVKEPFGVGHVVAVLRGENTDAVRRWRHETLSTYGLLRDEDKAQVRDWVHQLIGQGVLGQEMLRTGRGDEYPVLRLNAASWEVMKGGRQVHLTRTVKRGRKEKARDRGGEEAVGAWEGVDRALFDSLRGLRTQIARERQVPPYVIFGDATLRDMARQRPTTREALRQISGIGEVRLRDFGDRFLERLVAHARPAAPPAPPAKPKPAPAPRAVIPIRPDLSNHPIFRAAEGDDDGPAAAALSPRLREATPLFQAGSSVEDVARRLDWSVAAAVSVLCEFIRAQQPASISPWVDAATYRRVAQVARRVGPDRPNAIFRELGSDVSLDVIRPVLAHLSILADPDALADDFE